MSITRTLGGDRLGSGKKNFVTMRSYDRSTHDLGRIWRSTMAVGTLTPFMTEVTLPGDTFEIDLNCDVQTHPTVGPLFGSMKVQLDVFTIPIRLYNGKLHNNALGIGNKMGEIELPQMQMYADAPTISADGDNIDNTQINPSCIFSYLGIRGVGNADPNNNPGAAFREFNAIPFLGYWDIYKNYYANKQEEIGAVIHNVSIPTAQDIVNITHQNGAGPQTILPEDPLSASLDLQGDTELTVDFTGGNVPDWDQVLINVGGHGWMAASALFTSITNGLTLANLTVPTMAGVIHAWKYATSTDLGDNQPQVVTFSLSGIDNMRETILTQALTASGGYTINDTSTAPYGLPFKSVVAGGVELYSKMTPLEGLGLKTYQSDLFNNWIQTEWIDGVDGISAVTAVSTAGGSFTIDTLNISRKVYDMLNRIALSGGSYKDWMDTVWTETDQWIAETPMYMGGLIKELVFQEVVSNSQTADQPLGTLGGRGTLTKKHKGGRITIKTKEPSYIMGIVSITPRLDYSQGNKWDVNLKTMDDFHKPALDEIGFQDLITDQMAWWDTLADGNVVDFKSAGKQPAWLNYMTAVNEVRGNFAIEGNEMFMTLNRKYEVDDTTRRIKDLTTYIDPIKFNDIFAQTSRDAQNYWVQIGMDITARRIMSAKLIPNL